MRVEYPVSFAIVAVFYAVASVAAKCTAAADSFAVGVLFALALVMVRIPVAAAVIVVRQIPVL